MTHGDSSLNGCPSLGIIHPCKDNFLCDFEKVRLYETEKLFNQGDFIHRYQRS